MVMIASLTGLEHAVNLQTLILTHHKITISPSLQARQSTEAGLEQQPGHQPLALSGLVHLQYLDIHDNVNLRDLSPLAGMVDLEKLVLRYNSITELSACPGWRGCKTWMSTGTTYVMYRDLRVLQA